MTLSLRQVYTLSLYGLAAFAAWMLGRAEMADNNQTWWIPIATWGVLGISYFITEGPRGWYLPAWLANMIGLGAVLAAGTEFVSPGPEAKLLSGAHLLVYSTWIVAFQEKTLRIYWWMMALGILQVAVASVLTNGAAWYGLALFLYVAAALWTMSVASLYQIQLQYGGEGVVSAAGTDQQTSHFVQYDDRHRWLTWRFVGGWLTLLVASIMVGGAFFRFTPRMWVGPRNLFASDNDNNALSGRSQTGFSKEVRLGELGEILESVKPVMQVRVTDARTEAPVDLDRFAQRLGMSEALFRGATLSRYQRGRWAPVLTGRPMKLRQSFTQPGYRVDFDVEPRRDDVLFSIGLPLACAVKSRNEPAYLHPATGIVTREAVPDAAQRMSYTMFLESPPAELAAMQATALPVGIWWQSIETGYLRDNQLLPKTGLERLIQHSQDLVAAGERKAGRTLSNYDRAKLLESYLRDSGEFGYTLNLSIQDASIDPVEDFLFNRKEGHCEYYASTLALMLRAVGIPARLVTGFKGAEPGSGSNTWEVQERHAHAWVEAWTSSNLWVTLDATPANERQQNVEAAASKVGFWERLQTSSSNFWTDYVVQVTLQRQEEEIYGPIRDFALKIWAVLKSLFTSRAEMFASLRETLGNRALWTSPLGLVLLVGLGTCVFISARWLYRRLAWLRAIDWQAWMQRRRQQRAVVAFYDRFTRLAARAGMHRPAAQTPAEFAEEVSRFWFKLLEPANLETVPATVCTAYYRVRFGGETLDEGQLARLDSDLQALANLVTPGRRRSG